MVVFVVTRQCTYADRTGKPVCAVRTMTHDRGRDGRSSKRRRTLPCVVFIGIVLFIISLLINLAASTMIFRQRKRAERILS
jgi:ABC-type phosphate transport system permease subunit